MRVDEIATVLRDILVTEGKRIVQQQAASTRVETAAIEYARYSDAVRRRILGEVLALFPSYSASRMVSPLRATESSDQFLREFTPLVDSLAIVSNRSEERRVGKECVSTCRSRRSPYHKKK